MENWREKELGFANFLHQNVRFGHWIAIEFKDFIQHVENKKMCLFLVKKILMQAIGIWGLNNLLILKLI